MDWKGSLSLSYKCLSNQELLLIKTDFKRFSTQIKTLSDKNLFNCREKDLLFFLFMGKHIVFYKYLALQDKDHYFINRIISDIFYLIRSFICGEIRYAYLHERSLIENFIRFITSGKQETYFTHRLVEQFKENTNISDSDFSLIMSEYTTACGYVHYGPALDNKLSQVLKDCFDKYPLPEKELNAYYDRIQRLLTIFGRTLIQSDPDFISSSFHRKKNILEFLIGKKQKKLLQNRLMELTDQ